MTSGTLSTRSTSEQHAPPATGSADHHSRRRILAGLATAPVVAAVPIDLAIAQINDPHPVWLAEWEALVEWCNNDAPGDLDLVDCPEWHRSLELEELIGGAPARTLAGALCQLRVLRQWCTKESLPNDACDAALTNAMATIERLTGEAVHA
jgi:hypothetical protein